MLGKNNHHNTQASSHFPLSQKGNPTMKSSHTLSPFGKQNPLLNFSKIKKKNMLSLSISLDDVIKTLTYTVLDDALCFSIASRHFLLDVCQLKVAQSPVEHLV